MTPAYAQTDVRLEARDYQRRLADGARARGWKELKMVQRYSHLIPSHKAEALERMLEKKQDKTAGQPKKKSLRFSLHAGEPRP